VGLFDDLQSQLGAALGASSSPLAGELGKLLIDAQSGGLQGLVERFRAHGLGEVVDSWVAVGRNLPVSADQITQALGSDRVQQLAAATGIDVSSLAPKLAEILPQLVDHLTPGGKIPTGGLAGALFEQALSALQGRQQPKS
jgi:uncharacterized protein YidB (DUF937 family)